MTRIHTRAPSLSAQPEKGAAYWGQLHIRGDRSKPIWLPDRRVRRSVGTATSFRQFGRKEQVTYE